MSDQELSVLILAGGRSRRLGQDKVWLPLAGQPLVERVARRVLPLAGEILFSTREPERFGGLIAALPVPSATVADRYPDAGPLAGIQAGLSAARYELVLALAADMPFLNLPLLHHMLDLAPGHDAVVPQVRRRGSDEPAWEPLHAIYRRTCLPAIAKYLAAGNYQAFCFLPDVRTYRLLPDEVSRFDPEFRSFFNINTPDDWERGQQIVDTPRGPNL